MDHPGKELSRLLRDRRQVRLLLAARRGDSSAFQRLYGELYEPASRYLGARVTNRQDAEDLIAKVFHQFLENLDRFDPKRGSPTAWLLTMAHHALIDFYRRHRPTISIDHLEIAAGDSQPTPEKLLLREERLLRVQELLKRLPAETRRMLELRFDQELSYRDIAACLDLSEAAVKKRFSRVFAQLRERWKGSWRKEPADHAV